VGDTVTVNQILVEIETAKAAVELPLAVRRHGGGAAGRSRARPWRWGVPIIAISDGLDEPAAAEPAAGPACRPLPSRPAAEHPGAKIRRGRARVVGLPPWSDTAPNPAQ